MKGLIYSRKKPRGENAGNTQSAQNPSSDLPSFLHDRRQESFPILQEGVDAISRKEGNHHLHENQNHRGNSKLIETGEMRVQEIVDDRQFFSKGDEEGKDNHDTKVLNERIPAISPESITSKNKDDDSHVLGRLGEGLGGEVGVDHERLIVAQGTLVHMIAEAVPGWYDHGEEFSDAKRPVCGIIVVKSALRLWGRLNRLRLRNRLRPAH